MAAPLLLAVEDLSQPLASGPDGATPLRFLSEARSEGERVLCGFSSHESLAARAPSAIGLGVDPATVLDWLVESGCEGLLLDPAGPSAFVSHDDARELLGLPRRAQDGRRGAPRPECEDTLRAGLGKLLAAEDGTSAALVRERSTGKALRFERGEGDTLRLVLDGAPLAADERARAAVLFEEFAGGADDLPPLDDAPAPEPASNWIALFSGDLERPTRAGVKVFSWVFGFPPGFALDVALETDAGD
jgi:hypothetical protein